MRIAVVGRFPATVASPHTGPSRVALNLARAMLACGHQVQAIDIAAQSRAGIARTTVDGIERFEFAPYDGPAIATALLSFAPDVVHVHGSFAPQFHIPWLLRRFGRGRFAVVATVHGVASREQRYYRWPARLAFPGPLQRRLLQGADLVVANSDQTEMALSQDYGIVADAVISHGVDTDFFATTAPDPELCAVAAGRSVVLFVGAIEPTKGLEFLLRAAASSRREDWVLVLAGGAQEGYRRALHRRFADSFRSVRFHSGRVREVGALDQGRLRAVYAAADVCVLPSRYESFGLAGLEAMAAGKPLVVSDRVGMRTLLRPDQDGFIVPFGAADALAGTIDRLLADPELRSRVGREARARVASETWARKAAAYLDQFTSTLAATAQGRGR